MMNGKLKFSIFIKLASLIMIAAVTPEILFCEKVAPVRSEREYQTEALGLNDKPSPGGILTLDQALKKVVERNLSLLAKKWGVRSKDGAIQQAILFPNPEMEMELENFAGSGEANGFGQAEMTLQIGQMIPLGGKRKRKVNSAKLEKIIAVKNYEMELSDFIGETQKGFVKILHLQHRLSLREEMVEFAKEFIEKISLRVTAGKASPVELSRAKILLSRHRLALEELEMEIRASRQLLGALWGNPRPDFQRVKGGLDIVSQVPELQRFMSRLPQNPLLKRVSAEIDFQKSLLTLEKANRIPDPVVFGGIRRLNESRSTAFLIGVSVQIPVLDRSQGAVQSAGCSLKEAESSYKSVEVMIKSELMAAHEMLKAAHNHARTLKATIIPEAFKAFTTVSDGYGMGQSGYLEVFDAYSVYLELREEYLEKAAKYWYLMADLERLTGTGLEKAGRPF